MTPETAWRHVGGMRTLDGAALAPVIALAAWRQRTAIELDRPLGQVLADKSLVELARHRPTTAGGVRETKGLSPLAKARADAIAGRAMKSAPRGATRGAPAGRIPTRAASMRAQRWAETLLAIAHVVADETGMAPRLIATRADAEEFARAVDEHGLASPAVAALPALATWRRPLLGDVWVGWLEGRLALVGDAGNPHGVKTIVTLSRQFRAVASAPRGPESTSSRLSAGDPVEVGIRPAASTQRMAHHKLLMATVPRSRVETSHGVVESLCARILRGRLQLAHGRGRPHRPPRSSRSGTPLTAATATVASQQIARADLEPPWSLTASDGSGLVLSRVEAKSVLQGPLAFTELHLCVPQPGGRRARARSRSRCPSTPRCRGSRWRATARWLEAEVVEKQLARRAYDDFLHRRQDPALLEKAPGNQFTAKVFPIAPNADKHIVISLQPGARRGAYVLPLRGLPKIARSTSSSRCTGADGTRATQTLHERAWQPDRDFVASAPASAPAVGAGRSSRRACRCARAFGRRAADTRSRCSSTPARRARSATTRYVHSIGTLIGQLRAKYGDGIPLEVVAFDQDHRDDLRWPGERLGRRGDRS